MSIFCINGRFLTRPVTGVDRFARELVLELDKFIEKEEVEIAVPGNRQIVDCPVFESIKMVEVGNTTGHLWEQTQFSNFLRATKQIGVNLCNTAPLLNPGIVCIHDMAASAHPEFYKGKGIWRKIRLHFAFAKARAILTVSEFSKKEIEKYYPDAKVSIEVIYDAWQHMDRIQEDKTARARYGLEGVDYYFALSSLTKNKNLVWTVNTALLNPDCQFVIAGGINAKLFGDFSIPEAENVKYIGYVSDEVAKTLMSGCKAFLFPSFYEGFGIPPLEAMACGAQIIVSDIDVLHEVYGDSAIYIDPNVPVPNLSEMTESKIDGRSGAVLARFSWKSSAKKLYSVMKSVAGM